MNKEEEKKERLFPKIYSYIAGSRSKTMFISSDGENIISFPWLLGVLFLLVFDVPSWTIAVLLLFLVIFDLDLNVEDTYKKDALEKSTVKASEYKKKKVRKLDENSVVADRDGFYEITIR